MRGMPAPGRGHDCIDIRKPHLPAELSLRLGRVCEQSWRIPRPAWALDDFDRTPRDFLHSPNHGTIGGRCSCAEIVKILSTADRETVKDCDVRATEIVDMDIITQASAVGGRVVRTEQLEVRAFARRDVNGHRNEVGLGRMIFTDGAIRGGAGGIKISESGKAETVSNGERF